MEESKEGGVPGTITPVGERFGENKRSHGENKLSLVSETSSLRADSGGGTDRVGE